MAEQNPPPEEEQPPKRKKRVKTPKDAKLDMTPMIDVVFLLIIFFMLVAELSKMEAEALSLPTATMGTEDKNPPKGRIVVNVKEKGTIIISRREYSALQLRALLHQRSMLSRDADGLSTIAVKVRADANVQYKYVQLVMVQCMREYIWKLSFACMPYTKVAEIR